MSSGTRGLNLEAVVDPQVERAIAPQGEAIAQFGKIDEDDQEQRATVHWHFSKMCRWPRVSWCRLRATR